MNKSQLVAHAAAAAGVTKKAAQDVLEAVVAAVVSAVAKGDTVTVTNFGSWSRVPRQARDGRNPQTGATIKIPARKVPVFRAGKEFKDKVNK